jgi:hypothetical protein
MRQLHPIIREVDYNSPSIQLNIISDEFISHIHPSNQTSSKINLFLTMTPSHHCFTSNKQPFITVTQILKKKREKQPPTPTLSLSSLLPVLYFLEKKRKENPLGNQHQRRGCCAALLAKQRANAAAIIIPPTHHTTQLREQSRSRSSSLLAGGRVVRAFLHSERRIRLLRRWRRARGWWPARTTGTSWW